MAKNDLFEQVKDLIAKGDFSKAQKFIEDNKDNLGDYLDQAKDLVAKNKTADSLVDKVKGLFGK